VHRHHRLFSNSYLSIYCLGGLREVGRNCFPIHFKKEDFWIEIDCGKAPGSLGGEDAIVDQEAHTSKSSSHYLGSLRDTLHKIKHLFITHSHLDHAGALPEFYTMAREVAGDDNLPMLHLSPFGEKMTEAMFEYNEQELPQIAKLEGLCSSVSLSELVKVTSFTVPHSIPGTKSFIVKVKLPGDKWFKVLFMSDFRLQENYGGSQMAQAMVDVLCAERPFDIVIADMLYCDRPGYTQPEDETVSTVGKVLDRLLEKGAKQIVMSGFASNLERWQMISEKARELGIGSFHPKGTAMKTVWGIGESLGLFDGEHLGFGSELIACTGSQAEPYAVLTLASLGESQRLHIHKEASIILSSEIIPGNEAPVVEMVRRLSAICSEGYVVVSPSTYRALGTNPPENVFAQANIHNSGHGSQLDIKLLLQLAKPEFVIPYHVPMEKQGALGRFLDSLGVNYFQPTTMLGLDS